MAGVPPKWRLRNDTGSLCVAVSIPQSPDERQQSVVSRVSCAARAFVGQQRCVGKVGQWGRMPPRAKVGDIW